MAEPQDFPCVGCGQPVSPMALKCPHCERLFPAGSVITRRPGAPAPPPPPPPAGVAPPPEPPDPRGPADGTEQADPLIGALLNLGFLCLLAWAALQAGLKAAFTLLTALVGLRVIIIYFEVFGSLLQTGLGLVGGGLLTLLVAWVWLRKSKSLTARLTEGAES